ncbi:MAG: glycosyltransferase [Bacteroidetes bacterium]|nr:glycosyltransferase [Bacteroidota bacterium]
MTKQRSVIIIGSAYPLRGGGIATFNERLAKEFVDLGFDVQIETFKLQYPSILFPGKTQYSDEAAPENLKINVSINSINPFNWIKIGRKIKKLKPDLVVIRFWIPFMAPCLGTIARIIRKNNITKVVAIVDNIVPHEKHFGDRFLANYFVKNVDAFVTMSRSVLAELETFDQAKPKKYTLHPLYDNFGDQIPKKEALAKLKLSEDYRYILFFGFIRQYKGLDLVLMAMAEDWVKAQNIKLIVAGEFYSDSKPYFDLIEQLDIKDKVIMHNDFIPNTEVVNFFCAADIVVQPYKTATQSGVTQVAYHFDKPMIVTNVGGLAEIVPHEKVGYVVDVDHKEIANAIKLFYENDPSSAFINNIKYEKKKYSWGKMIEVIELLQQEINKK